MKRVLMVSSVASMIEQFNLSNIEILQDLGYQVDVATNFKEPGTITIEKSEQLVSQLKENNVGVYQIDFHRYPFSNNNLQAYKSIAKLLETESYDLVHAHSPIGGVLTRLATKKYRNSGTEVIYTAHGFHFFKGGPVRDWLMYYPIERFFSKYTDTLITINQEDYEISKRFNANKNIKIPSVGTDIEYYIKNKTDITSKRVSLNIPKDSYVISSIGEIDKRKNHRVIVEAMNLLQDKSIHFVLCGKGPQQNELESLAIKYNLEERVHFLGYRDDIADILNISNIFAFPSRREGLGMAAVEAMASGLPILTSNVGGINDYSEHGITGYKFDPDDVKGFAWGIKEIKEMPIDELQKIQENNIETSKRYDIKKTNEIMRKVYSKDI